ncbi:WxcM-like domain-containing protein [Sphingobacterium mizutaii]|uniref:WxcM-like domain-containing protein n=1 Tax=Sphingobacterium mizutaii TaxID=1010 RepID=UPI00162614A5|nr:WxcM-like domain-containing protein [Sphingobacterium mizutaii]
MRIEINFIEGGESIDARGSIKYVNSFDMTKIKRFYIISNADTEMIRGWRGHKIEERWFYVISGEFELDIVKIDDWDLCDRNLDVNRYQLKAEDNRIVHLPCGYATAFRALKKDSKLLVYSNFGLDHAKNDDYVWPIDYFVKKRYVKS